MKDASDNMISIGITESPRWRPPYPIKFTYTGSLLLTFGLKTFGYLQGLFVNSS